MNRRSPKGLMAVLMAGALMGLFSQHAYASVGDYVYDNTRPESTYAPDGTTCDWTAQSPVNDIINVNGGNTELRFSAGCKTVWARFTCTSPSGCRNVCVTVHRQNDDAWLPYGECRDAFDSSALPYLGQMWSNQLYDAGSLATQACTSSWLTQGVRTCTMYY
jgi:hypothetical protein